MGFGWTHCIYDISISWRKLPIKSRRLKAPSFDSVVILANQSQLPFSRNTAALWHFSSLTDYSSALHPARTSVWLGRYTVWTPSNHAFSAYALWSCHRWLCAQLRSNPVRPDSTMRRWAAWDCVWTKGPPSRLLSHIPREVLSLPRRQSAQGNWTQCF